MKVLFDHQIFEAQKYGGVSRYFAELIRELNLITGVDTELSVKYSNNVHLKEALPGFQVKEIKGYESFLPHVNFKGKRKLYNFYNKNFGENTSSLNKQESIKLLGKGDYDIFHPTYYDSYYHNIKIKQPIVVTVYDMINEIYPEYFYLNHNIKSISDKKDALKNATHIISISENTKKDLIKLYGLDESKITVIHLASSFHFDFNSEDLNLKKQLPGKYLLFTGQRTIYKNFYFFIFSISEILKEDKELKLVCSGPSFTYDEIQLINSLGLKEKILHFFVDDLSLPLLYKNALAFIFPSIYEGFGIPILEAFNCGCPALISNTSCFPEIAGDAALYFDPKDFKSIQKSVKQILNSKALREEMKVKGLERQKNFSWKITAEKTKQVYGQLLT